MIAVIKLPIVPPGNFYVLKKQPFLSLGISKVFKVLNLNLMFLLIFMFGNCFVVYRKVMYCTVHHEHAKNTVSKSVGTG